MNPVNSLGEEKATRLSSGEIVETLSYLKKNLNPRILVVEDDESQWPLWEHILSQFPKSQVDWCSSEEDAESYIRSAIHSGRQYHLIICDVFLAGQRTGIDLWNRFGEAASNYIFVTGTDLQKTALFDQMDFGYPILFKKPLRVRDVRDTIQEMLEEAQ